MEKSTYKITGKTFERKNKIKKAGGKWIAAEKCWFATLHKSDSLFRYEGDLIFTPVKTKTSNSAGICPICKTFCYGDCKE